MDLENIKSILYTFSTDRDWKKYHSPKNLLMALSGEVGELNEIFQWLNEEDSYNLPDEVLEHTKEEIADIAVYLIRICMKLDIDLESTILSKMEKNIQKYQVELCKGSSKKYNQIKVNLKTNE